jgi:hypothetical protein
MHSLSLGLFLVLQNPGVLPEWEIKQRVEKLTAEVRQLAPVLEQVNPSRWSDSAAAAQYVPHYQTALREVEAMPAAVQEFSSQPEKLSVALRLLFRIDGLNSSAGLLGQGVRRYQNPATADILDATVRQSANTRDVLRQHVQDLAALREKELEVADKEAQRCRSQLARPGAPKRQ